MTPLHRLERRLLRECATWLLRARFIFRHPSDVGEATHGFLLTNYLEAAASLAEEYRDLRDARRILLDMAKKSYCPLHCGRGSSRSSTIQWDHAPDCALERIAK